MSQHDWRNWETCKCGEPGCRSSYPNRKWEQMNEDPIAAHLTELITDAPAPNHEEDNYDAGYVAALADLRDSAAFKLVVEQHTNGRIARLREHVEELAARGLPADLNPTVLGKADYAWWSNYLRRIDSTVRSNARAALEGEQQ